MVIGGGHAGVEAAWAAANALGGSGSDAVGRVALVSLDASKIGVMSCNPAIGGLAKGQLVREVDALGGLMGLATDATGIQFRVLNTSKGPAVHGPRAQCDKHAYALQVQAMIASRPQIVVIQGSVEDIITTDDVSIDPTATQRVRGVAIRGAAIARLGGGNITDHDGNPVQGPTDSFTLLEPLGDVILHCGAAVLTTGTFMRGLMHTGPEKREGGRFGEAAAVGISGALSRLGFELGRLKTGTPPRLKRSTIDWDALEPQWGDDPAVPFSDITLHQGAFTAPWHITRDTFCALRQVECRQTSTAREAHELIRANLHLAPMYSGQIEGVGPRYCPSLEDKVVRFADRETHGVFLEPESLRDDWIYCNGISTSLPAFVQDQIVTTMPGCARAEILRYGYAVEYDMVRPHQITAAGGAKHVAGLYLAGQINGTSGYEEAAAQGLVAGVNAVRFVRGEDPYIFTRDSSYIGVLMDDLVTKTPKEPYRMFTSRAEHRLLLRSDNSAERLTPIAQSLGLLHDGLGASRLERFANKTTAKQALNALIDVTQLDGQPLSKHMRADVFTLDDLRNALPQLTFDRAAFLTVLADRRYETYITRQRAEIRRQSEMEHRPLPPGIDYTALHTMRTEARHALQRFKPQTFGQASRLEGITPADITVLSVLIRQHASRAD